MARINLLPQELKPKGYVLKLSKTLNKLALISIAILLAAAFVFLGSFIFFSQQTKASLGRQESLKSEIRALEATEQKLILVKDRIQKIGKVLNVENTTEELGVLKQIVEILPEGVSFNSVGISDSSVELEVTAPNLLSIGQFFLSIINSQGFQKVTVTGFSYKLETGYVVGLIFF